MKEEYMLGGFYLVHLEKYPDKNGSKIYTCSSAINELLMSDWSFDWDSVFYLRSERRSKHKELMQKFNIKEDSFKDIKKWTNEKLHNNLLAFCEIFFTKELALEYYHSFFNTPDHLLSIYFVKEDIILLRDNYAVRKKNVQEPSVLTCLNLRQHEVETDDDVFLGFDLVGVTQGGELESFHYHGGLTEHISIKFGLQINKCGLYDPNIILKEVAFWLNDNRDFYHDIPWFLVKVKESKLIA